MYQAEITEGMFLVCHRLLIGEGTASNQKMISFISYVSLFNFQV